MKVALATTQPNGCLSLQTAIPCGSDEGEVQHSRIFTRQNEPREARNEQKDSVLPRKKIMTFTTLTWNGHFGSGK